MIEGSDRIDQDHFKNELRRKDWYKSYAISANYTINDDDQYKTFFVTTAANVITVTLPTAADNVDRVIEIVKVDSTFDKTGATSKITVDGEGAETLNGQATIDIELQYCGLRIKCNGTGWIVLDTIGDCELRNIGGTLEIIYRKYFQGTTDADAQTQVAHGVVFGNIVQATAHIYTTDWSSYCVFDFRTASHATSAYFYYFDATNLIVENVGASCQGQNYRLQIEYYV